MAAESKHSHERQTLPNAAEALRGCAYRLQLLHVFLKLNFVKNEKLMSCKISSLEILFRTFSISRVVFELMNEKTFLAKRFFFSCVF